MAEAWHRQITPILEQYHYKYARQPMAAINDARSTLTRYTDYLASKLRERGLCSRVEYTGSAYDGVKVSNDIEFDIMVIKTGETLETITRYNSSVEDFYGTLEQLINKHREMSRLVKLRRHGPAVQMDVYRDEWAKAQGNAWFLVDVVPSYQIGNCLYVVKSQTRRQSFSLEEKALFNGMDRDNGCRKKVLRILKVWRNREPGTHKLTSYHLKTALFHEVKAHPNWSQSELGPRLIGVLRRLHGDMERGYQSHYFNPHVNLLDNMPRSTIDNIRDRLQRIIRNEQVFTSVFK